MQRLAESERRARAAREEAEARLAAIEARLEAVLLAAAETERELRDHLAVSLEQLQQRLDLENEYLEQLNSLTTALEASDAEREAEGVALLEAAEARYAALLQDREELQARYDWLLVRFTGREPRQQDVAMMTRLQEELSRQMSMTAYAVQSAREYKYAPRAAHTRLNTLHTPHACTP